MTFSLKRLRRCLVAALLVGTVAGGSSVAAVAADPGSATGGDVSSPAAEFANDPESKAKVALTELWRRALDGKVAPADYEKAATAYRAAHKLAKPAGYRSLTETGGVARDGGTVSKVAASRTLPLTHYAQINKYFCGPATGAMLIKSTNGAIRSRYNGASFSQGHLGGPAHMQTETYQATRWASKQFVRGVNRWRGSKHYVQVDRPSGALMKAALTQSIGGNGMPLAADTVEVVNGDHYNKHPNKLIGHWILAYGYANAGATVKFGDPSTSVWRGVAKTFSAPTSTFTATYLQNNGIAY